MPKFILHYFKSRGQGECARLLLAYGGEEWEDKRYSIEEFRNTIKDKMPNGQLPILEIDCRLLPESNAIYRFLARRYNLMGKDEFESAMVDAILDQYKDFFSEIKDFVLTAVGFMNKGDVDTLRQDLYVPASKKYWPKLKAYIEEAGNGYLTKGGPTLADFFFSELFDSFDVLCPGLYAEYPEFKKLHDQVHALPQLQEYLKNRPQLKL